MLTCFQSSLIVLTRDFCLLNSLDVDRFGVNLQGSFAKIRVRERELKICYKHEVIYIVDEISVLPYKPLCRILRNPFP